MIFNIIAISSLVFFFYLPKSSFADSNIVINEFYALGGSSSDPDWVELYNKSDDVADLEKWVIRDSTESNKLIITGSICPHNFRKFSFSNRLNNSGDKIRLLQSVDSQSSVDEITYFSNDIPIHLQNQSTGRIPNGSNTWQVLTDATPSDDTSCDPHTPEPEPSQAASLSPSTSPTTSKTSQPSPIRLASRTPSVQNSAAKISPTILGEATKSSSQSGRLNSSTPVTSLNPSPTEQKPQNTKVAYYTAGLGTILIATSLTFYFMAKRKTKIGKKDDDQDFYN